MVLKKYLVAFTLGVVVLAGPVMAVSCISRGLDADEYEIGVFPVSSVDTKGSSNGPIAGTAFDHGRTILLSAYLNDPDDANNNKTYFTNIPFTYNAGISKWAGGSSGTPNPKYWPHKGTMDFIALSKEGLAGTVTATPASQIVYAMPDNSSNQDDVMMAYVSGRSCSEHDLVPLSFRHAQAQVSVKTKLASNAGEQNYGITVRSVTLRRARYSGTVTGTATGTNGITFSWGDVASGTQADVAFGTSSLILSSTAQAYGKGILLPAQSPTGVAGTIDILIEYTLVVGANYPGAGDSDPVITGVYTIPATSWTAGNKYTYVFTLSRSGLACEVNVTEWIDGSTYTETI